MVTAEFDKLARQGEAYATRLAEAGVAVRLVRGTGLDHGFLDKVGFARRPDEVLAEIVSAVRSVLQP